MTLTVWSDVGCPWASLLVWRLHARRAALGLDVPIDHRCFPLELFNEVPSPRDVLDAEVEAIAPLIPDAGWRPWSRGHSEYPVSTLLALEAVQAAKEQGGDASERLDLSLRQAFWRDSRCISLRHEVLDAAELAEVDVKALAEALDSGRFRQSVVDDWRAAVDGAAEGSPTVVLPDGTRLVNPGVKFHWEGPKPGGRPIVDSDDQAALDEVLRKAASS